MDFEHVSRYIVRRGIAHIRLKGLYNDQSDSTHVVTNAEFAGGQLKIRLADKLEIFNAPVSSSNLLAIDGNSVGEIKKSNGIYTVLSRSMGRQITYIITLR